MAAEIALTHHERWDGQGYPNGRSGEEILLVGRVCALVDVFDIMTMDRPYRRARPTKPPSKTFEPRAARRSTRCWLTSS
ncbi:MAG: HD domain-containing phosphohydrolase [Dehalococcoidia bacterium]